MRQRCLQRRRPRHWKSSQSSSQVSSGSKDIGRDAPRDLIWATYRRCEMLIQAEKGKIFHALHERNGAFIIPNPWDVGTARLLAHLGFEALATTSAGYAFSVGRRDNRIDRA